MPIFFRGVEDFLLLGGSWQKLLSRCFRNFYIANGSDQWVINVITCFLNLSNPLLTSWGYPSRLVLKKMSMCLTCLKKKRAAVSKTKYFFNAGFEGKIYVLGWTIQLRQTAFGMYLMCVFWLSDFGWPAGLMWPLLVNESFKLRMLLVFRIIK